MSVTALSARTSPTDRTERPGLLVPVGPHEPPAPCAAFDRADWVCAAPFRAHLRHLMSATGLPWRVIGLTADVRPEVLERLLCPGRGRTMRRISPLSAAALLSLTVGDLQALAWQRHPAEQVAAEIASLSAAGFDDRTLAGFLRLTTAQVSALRLGGRAWSTRLTWSLARAARAAHGLIDLPELEDDEDAA